MQFQDLDLIFSKTTYSIGTKIGMHLLHNQALLHQKFGIPSTIWWTSGGGHFFEKKWAKKKFHFFSQNNFFFDASIQFAGLILLHTCLDDVSAKAGENRPSTLEDMAFQSCLLRRR